MKLFKQIREARSRKKTPKRKSRRGKKLPAKMSNRVNAFRKGKSIKAMSKKELYNNWLARKKSSSVSESKEDSKVFDKRYKKIEKEYKNLYSDYGFERPVLRDYENKDDFLDAEAEYSEAWFEFLADISYDIGVAFPDIDNTEEWALHFIDDEKASPGLHRK